MKLKIDYKFPSLNDYITAERTNKYKASKIKKDLTDLVALECKRQKIPKFGKVLLTYTWIEKNKKRDKDNIYFNQKFIQDGLVHAGVIKNDGWENVKGFKHMFEIGADYGVEIEIEEA